jgi:hypothetical protein
VELIGDIEQGRVITEAELERSFLNSVEDELRSHGAEPTIEQQRKIVRGRSDARIGGLIFEFKKPGLKDLSVRESQVTRYIDEYGQKSIILRGILTNGARIILIDENKEVVEDGKLEDNVWILETWVASLAMKVASPIDLRDRLGPSSSVGKAIIRDLFETYQRDKVNPLVLESYRVWDAVYGCATNLDENATMSVRSFAKKSLDIQLASKTDVKSLLFTIETYLSILMKMLVAEVAIQKNIVPAASLDELFGDYPLIGYARLSERISFLSRIFEYDSFSWFVDMANQYPELGRKLADYLIEIAHILSLVDFTGVSTDLVKQMYQGFFDPATRRALGEFYTPDDLVDQTLDSVEYRGDATLTSTLLDPACGSGTFLVRAIDRFIRVCESRNLERNESLKRVTGKIVGIDIHPFAVAMARVNYLLALARLIDASSRKAIRSLPIPVYWADSLARSTEKTQFGGTTQVRTVEIRIPVLGTFVMPDPKAIEWDIVIDMSLMAVEEGWSDESYLSRFPERVSLEYGNVLLRFLRIFKDRKTKGLDGRWLSTLRNFIVVDKLKGRCDLVVGNPPWVRIHNISEEIRDELMGKFEVYARDKAGGRVVGWNPALKETRIPFPQQIDYCMAFVEAGLGYLRTGGRLGFVLTAKTMNALYANLYRRMLVDDTTIVRLIDYSLSTKQFFEEATNYPMILAIEKSKQTKGTDIEVYAREKMHWSVNQMDLPILVNDHESPWCIAPPNVIRAFRRMQEGNTRLGDVYSVHMGVKTSANDVFLVKEFNDTASRSVVAVTNAGGDKRTVEKDLLRPVIRGEDLAPWEYKTSGYIIWTHTDDGSTVLHKLPANAMRYFESYRERLASRDDYKKGQPLWTIFRVSPEKLAEKTGWGELARMMEAVVIPSSYSDERLGERRAIPLQTVYFVSSGDSDLDYALAAFLNSTPVRSFLVSFAERARGRYFRHFSWTVGLIPLPDQLRKGKGKQPAVKSLAGLSREMHSQRGKDDEVADKIDGVVGNMFGLSREDLDQLKQYLRQCGVIEQEYHSDRAPSAVQ